MKTTPSKSTKHERGVFVAPWVGPNGEHVLIAIDSRGRLVGEPTTVEGDCVFQQVAEVLWELLEGHEARTPTLRLVQ